MASNSATVCHKCRFVFQILWYCTAKASLQKVHLYSICRCVANKTYNAYDLLKILRVYEDTAKEYFDVPELSMHEVDEGFYVEQDIVQIEHNSALLPDRGQISNRDTIIWLYEFWLQSRRPCKRNKINTRTTGYYTFLLERLDDAKDLFQYLWDR